MLQFDKHIWTPRFLLLAGLTLVGQIVLGIIASLLLGFSSLQTELVLTIFLFISGIVLLDWVRATGPRKIMLGAGFFVLLALLFLTPTNILQANHIVKLLDNPLLQALYSLVFALTLVIFLGWLLSPKTKQAGDDVFDRPAHWFARLGHVALAGITGITLLLQIPSGTRLLLLPFSSRLFAGVTLNTVIIWLLAVLLIASLLRLRNPLSIADGWIILLLALACSLFQYTFGNAELARLLPTLSEPQISGINLVLSIVPLALAIFALFSRWSRFFTPFWLTLQLFFLHSLSSILSAPTHVTSPSLTGQVFTFLLAITLILLLLRLVYYGDRRQLNPVDAVTVGLIALILLFTLWSAGQSAVAFIIGLCLLLAIGVSYADLFLHSRFPWLKRATNIIYVLLVLSITVGGLLMLNSVGNQSTYIAAEALNPHRWNASLPTLPIRNQYALDVLFALLLLLYVIALVRQRWNRTFSHTERMLVFLSGGVCWLVLASNGPQALLPLVATNLQNIGSGLQSTFTVESIATLSILLAALVSLLWLIRMHTMVGRILLLALFILAALCALLSYITALPLLLLIALPLLLAGTLIAARIDYMQTHPLLVSPAMNA